MRVILFRKKALYEKERKNGLACWCDSRHRGCYPDCGSAYQTPRVARRMHLGFSRGYPGGRSHLAGNALEAWQQKESQIIAKTNKNGCVSFRDKQPFLAH